jgi:hypothetical protein
MRIFCISCTLVNTVQPRTGESLKGRCVDKLPPSQLGMELLDRSEIRAQKRGRISPELT